MDSTTLIWQTMKRKYISMAALLLLTLSLTYSCKKPAAATEITTFVDGSVAQVKFFNFGVGSPSINFYGNGVKISAVSSATGTEATTGVASGLVFPATNYAVLQPGAYTFKGQIPATAAADGNLAIATVAATLEAGKYYSLYTSGIYNTTAKTSDAFVLEDVLPAQDFTVAYVRFVNVVPNAPSGFNMFAKNTVTTTESAVGGTVAYKAASTFVAVPPGIYELYARFASAPGVNVISRNGTSVVSLTGGRFYTFAARGDYTNTGTTKPSIDFTAIK
jgi:hypothetical protein